MKDSLGFRLFFVGKSEDDVEVMEVEHIDFEMSRNDFKMENQFS